MHSEQLHLFPWLYIANYMVPTSKTKSPAHTSILNFKTEYPKATVTSLPIPQTQCVQNSFIIFSCTSPNNPPASPNNKEGNVHTETWASSLIPQHPELPYPVWLPRSHTCTTDLGSSSL